MISHEQAVTSLPLKSLKSAHTHTFLEHLKKVKQKNTDTLINEVHAATV